MQRTNFIVFLVLGLRISHSLFIHSLNLFCRDYYLQLKTSIHMIWGPVTVIHIYQLDKLDWHEKHRYNHQKLWNLKILIFWPKMTKCQTNLVRRKIFHRFFGLFSSQNHSIRKKKILKIFSFFWKFWPKMTLFGPNLGPNLVKRA